MNQTLPTSVGQTTGQTTGQMTGHATGVATGNTPARAHPPTSPGPVEIDDTARVWPSVIGIIVLVLQGIGLLMSLVSAASSFLDFEQMVSAFVPAGTFDAAKKWESYSLAMYGVAAVLALVALWGAILLLMRRRSGVQLLLVWAVMRVPYAVYAGWVTARVQADGMASVQTGGPPMPATAMPFIFASTWLFTALFSMVLPTFLVIWFCVPRVRRQTRAW